MRHKYSTPALVLARTPLAEAGMLVTLLTSELGLIRARAEGVRRSGAKLAHALQTLTESDVMLVRGKEGWRLTGALLTHSRFRDLSGSARKRAARVATLLLRLVHGEEADGTLYSLFSEFVEALAVLDEPSQDVAESLIALRLLHALGFVSGELPPRGYDAEILRTLVAPRSELIARINHGIAASGL